jgi:hypothetical protein
VQGGASVPELQELFDGSHPSAATAHAYVSLELPARPPHGTGAGRKRRKLWALPGCGVGAKRDGSILYGNVRRVTVARPCRGGRAPDRPLFGVLQSISGADDEWVQSNLAPLLRRAYKSDDVVQCADCASCNGAHVVAIPPNVSSIDDTAFAGCVGLNAIMIPASVLSIGDGAFQYCASLSAVSFAHDSNLTVLPPDTFNGCANLTTINLPATLRKIGDEAFIDCTSLSSLDIPNVTEIGQLAFAQCVGLTEVSIPDSVTTIGAEAFLGCANLTSIFIPDTATTIGSRAFEQCGCPNSSSWGAGTHVCHCVACDCTGT